MKCTGHLCIYVRTGKVSDVPLMNSMQSLNYYAVQASRNAIHMIVQRGKFACPKRFTRTLKLLAVYHSCLQGAAVM